MRRWIVLCLLAVVALSGCSDDATDTPSPSHGACPADPIPVVVSVDQWGDIVSSLAGECGTVTTIIAGSSTDPHDYEPSPADGLAFEKASVVVVNGAGYDTWANDFLKTTDNDATVIDIAQSVGVKTGENPHIWYSPDDVMAMAAKVTSVLEDKMPAAKDYLEAQSSKWHESMKAYTDLVASLKKEASGKTYVASEGVFDYMAQAIGLNDLTPAGYRSATANESEPAPGDVQQMENILTSSATDVYIDNVQTQGAMPAQLLGAALDGRIPVVDVTETMAPDSKSFADWQITQLTALQEALKNE